MRGTIGGRIGNNLTPIDLVELTAAYASWLLDTGNESKVVIGRDGRISGEMVSQIVSQTLISMGIDVVDLGLSTTPTVEVAVTAEKAGGGIICTASHNPKEWNALKFLNHKGEFISAEAGTQILQMADSRDLEFAHIDDLGRYTTNDSYIGYHIDQIYALDIINLPLIQSKKYKVVVDCINSTGAIALPPLLEKAGCEYVLLNAEVSGQFAHDPEPLPKNLSQLAAAMVEHKADLGISVDPDVDRLVLVCEDGSMFGEEYTLVAAADFVLQSTPGNTVSNLSSTRALADVTTKYGGRYSASAVGEVNVVLKMKEVNAVIGGEGNGGIIYPGLHYGRDAMLGVAMILNLMAIKDLSLSHLRKTYTDYHIVKEKITLEENIQVTEIITKIKNAYLEERLNMEDGIKIDFDHGWVHVRASNTEPVLRIIAEAKTETESIKLANKIKSLIA